MSRPTSDALADLVQRGYRFAYSLTHDPAAAEDVLQDAWVAILRIGGPWTTEYLFSVIRNRFIDLCRRQKLIAFGPLDAGPERAAADGMERSAESRSYTNLVRDICLSNAYQRSTIATASNAADSSNFSHAEVRRIRAESLLDSISRVTDTRDKFRGLPLGARAVQIADGNTSTYFLTTFGRAKRESVCTCEVVMEPNLSQALHLLNGETTHQKIRDGKVVAGLLAGGASPDAVVERLYVACLSRKPTDAELQSIRGMLAEAPDPAPVLEDLFWALLNSKEFIFNH